MTEINRSKIKVLHLITGLNTGGAEMMLYKLLSLIDRMAFQVEVVSLTDTGPVGKKIEELGLPVQALGMRRGVPDPRGLLRLVRRLRQAPPDCIQTWMYHADLIGGLAAKLAGDTPIVWGIRRGNLDPQGTKRSTLWTARICARLSRRLPVRIVSCSEASRHVHEELGYDTGRMVVIPNGFDLTMFKPDPSTRPSVRRELGISPNALLIGLVGRFHPLKDHHNFISAAAQLYTDLPSIYFMLCGDGVTWENRELAGRIKASGIQSRCLLLGRREDIPRLTASLDIASSSSLSEGFPNVIGEAMACGVPCVVTDVGDSALIVGNTGRVVPPRNPAALAGAWRELIELGPEDRKQLGCKARQRVAEYFNLSFIVKQYEELYREVKNRVQSDRFL